MTKWYHGWSIRVLTPDGTIFVHFGEDEKHKLKGIWLNLGKAGSAVAAWAYALQEMINFSIDNGATLEDLIEKLASITSDGSPRIGIGGRCKSGPEGIWMALMLYRKELHKEAKKNVRFIDSERILADR